MKKIICILFFANALQLSAAEAEKLPVKKSVRYPRILEVSGSPTQLDKNGAGTAIKVGTAMTEKVTYLVPLAAKLKVQLDANSVMTIRGGSIVELPILSWETGESEKIILHEGEFHFKCLGECQRTVDSPLSSDSLTEGEFEFQYEKEVPKVTVKVLKGSVSFRGLENEESIALSSGQTAFFKGDLEGGVPTYDVLLKGRKVARGKLSPVSALELPKEETVPVKIQKKTKSVASPKSRFAKAQDSVCQKPVGGLNQCAWICEKKSNKLSSGEACPVSKGLAQCVRYRCNANGNWSDPIILSEGQNRCTKAAQVAECDY